jgi:nucleoside 2-deoxyribosyltransferase
VATIYRLLDDVAERRLCFVLIPFDKEFNTVYSKIKEIASERGYYCSRDSEMSGHSVIMDTIKEMIMRSDLIIADLSSKNPNVFYELGYAHALGKNAILLTQDPEVIPFDLRQRRYIHYENTNDLSEKLKLNLPIRKKY